MEWTIVNYDSLMDNIKRIHFIGIGGSGMCPLAEILHHEGYELSGSDMNEGETLDRIKGYGILFVIKTFEIKQKFCVFRLTIVQRYCII